MNANPYEPPQSIPPPEPIRWPQRLITISLYLCAILPVLTLIGWTFYLRQSGAEALLMASPYFALIMANLVWKRSRTIQTGILVAAVPVVIFGSFLVLGIFTYDRAPGPELMGMAMGSLFQIVYIAIVAAATSLAFVFRRT